jgi:hypothetical protein
MQDKFLDLVIEPEFTLVKILEEFVGNQREEFARAFVNVLVAQHSEVEGLMALLDNEVNSAKSARILFRGNSITTKGISLFITNKAIDYYMKLVGSQYLYSTLHPIMEKFYKENNASEVDINKISAKVFGWRQGRVHDPV